MARKVRWTAIAASDLDGAAEYISRDSPFFAGTFVRRVLDAASELKRSPNLGFMVDELGDPEICQRIVCGYRLVYTLRNKCVYVLGLIHSARDFPTVWNADERDVP